MRAALTGTTEPVSTRGARSAGSTPPPACRQAACTSAVSVQALDPLTDKALSTAWAAIVVSAGRSRAGSPRRGGAVIAALSDVSRVAVDEGCGDGLVVGVPDGFAVGVVDAPVVVPAVAPAAGEGV